MWIKSVKQTFDDCSIDVNYYVYHKKMSIEIYDKINTYTFFGQYEIEKLDTRFQYCFKTTQNLFLVIEDLLNNKQQSIQYKQSSIKLILNRKIENIQFNEIFELDIIKRQKDIIDPCIYCEIKLNCTKQIIQNEIENHLKDEIKDQIKNQIYSKINLHEEQLEYLKNMCMSIKTKYQSQKNKNNSKQIKKPIRFDKKQAKKQKLIKKNLKLHKYFQDKQFDHSNHKKNVSQSSDSRIVSLSSKSNDNSHKTHSKTKSYLKKQSYSFNENNLLLRKRINDCRWNSFFIPIKMASSSKFSYTIKVIQTKYRKIRFGVVTDKYKQCASVVQIQQNSQSVMYNLLNGEINIQGNQEDKFESIGYDCQLKLTINLQQKYIQFMKNNLRQHTIQLPQFLLDKKLLINIEMFNENDELKLLG